MLDKKKVKKTLADELVAKGKVTLIAKTRDSIYQQSEGLTLSIPEGTRWTRSIVQYNPEAFEYKQTITIIK